MLFPLKVNSGIAADRAILRLKLTLGMFFAAGAAMAAGPLAEHRPDNAKSLASTGAVSAIYSAPQDTGIVVKGRVTDTTGMPLPGVSITLKTDPLKGVQTNPNGEYTFKLSAPSTLVFTFMGFTRQEMRVTTGGTFNIQLKSNESQLGEVAIVAFGTQKKTTMVGSVTTINPKELKGPTSNLTTMLAGRLAGVVAYQTSGEPGRDDANFFIRGITSFGTGKVNPLILIDGRESTTSDLARLQPDDIAGFSILKDATASSLYGARGANGVVLVSTKSGEVGNTRFNVRAENSNSRNTRNVKLADNITYMRLANEARVNSGLTRKFSEDDIRHRVNKDNPYVYPDMDWVGTMIKPSTNNQRINANVSGGAQKAQYYVSGSYNIDNGILRTIDENEFNSNIRARNYEIRSNVNIKMTPTTEAIVRTTGRFYDYRGPRGGGGTIFSNAVQANPVAFPAYYPKSYAPEAKHALFGGAFITERVLYMNPFAEAVSGFEQNSNSTLNAQLEIKQDLGLLVPGLTGRVMAFTQRYASYAFNRSYVPFYYTVAIDPDEGPRGLVPLNPKEGRPYLDYNEGGKEMSSLTYMEAALNYNRTIGKKHEVGGMLIGILSNNQPGNAGWLIGSLPKRNQGLSGRFTYDYDKRYLLEFTFGYNGSERFDKRNRFGFFPSVGGGWNVSEEPWFENLLPVVSRLKFRGTYGIVGNDQIGPEGDRFFYMSDVNLGGGPGYTFGENFSNGGGGVYVNRYENKLITWERAYKTNLGMEMGLFNKGTLQIDYFRERRDNILMDRNNIPTTMGLNSVQRANVGVAQGQGFEVALDVNHSISKKSFLSVRGTFTYATSKYLEAEEPNYPESLKHLYWKGQSLKQMWGYVADRLFIDDAEAQNSPVQQFGKFGAGDIKYVDINRDGVINYQDRVPVGHPWVPEINYGFGFTYKYGAFDISAFFQGSARSSFFINPNALAPFIKSARTEKGLLEVVANDRWTEDNQNPYAFWPRLYSDPRPNNTELSTWWLRDGAYMRLKTMEVGFDMPAAWTRRARLHNLRLYVNGLNLFTFSRFKMWDVELGGNEFNYPIQRVVNIGVNVGF